MQQNKRQKQVSSEIMQVLGEYFIQDGKAMLNNVLTSVSRVEMSPDLRNAKIYISFYDENNQADDVFRIIQENVKLLRHYIAQNVRLRYVPELRIYKDDSMEYADRINKILRDLGE
jgi:ribosome-binding factor A